MELSTSDPGIRFHPQALLHAGAVPALLGSLEPVLDLYFLYSSSNESCTVPSLPPTASLCESRSIPAAAPSTTTVASSTTTTSRAQRSGSSHYEAGAEIVPTRGGSDAELDPTGSAAALDVGSESGSDGEETEDERAEAAEGVLQVLQRLMMLESPTAPALGQLGLPPSPEIESDCSESRAGKSSTGRTRSASASTSACAVLRRAILVSEPGGLGRVRSLAAAVLARCAMESVAEDNRVASPTSKGDYVEALNGTHPDISTAFCVKRCRWGSQDCVVDVRGSLFVSRDVSLYY